MRQAGHGACRYISNRDAKGWDFCPSRLYPIFEGGEDVVDFGEAFF
jgi:hypothetical protein